MALQQIMGICATGVLTLLLVAFLIWAIAGGRPLFRSSGQDIQTTVQDAGQDLKRRAVMWRIPSGMPFNRGIEMKKTMVIMCPLLLVMPTLIFQLVGCGAMKKEPDPSVSAYENAEFKREGDAFNSKENQEIRAKELADKEAEAEAEVKRKRKKPKTKVKGKSRWSFKNRKGTCSMNVNYFKMIVAVTAAVFFGSMSVRASETADVRRVSGEIGWIDVQLGKLELNKETPTGTKTTAYSITENETRVTDPADEKFLNVGDLRAGQYVTIEVADGQEDKIVPKIIVEPMPASEYQLAFGELKAIDVAAGTFTVEERVRIGQEEKAGCPISFLTLKLLLLCTVQANSR